MKKIFAVPDMAATQPVTYARAGAPPALLIHGADDRTVRPRNSVSLSDALEAAGSTAEVRLYDGIDHIEIIAALAAPLRWLAGTRADLVDFLGLEKEEPAG